MLWSLHPLPKAVAARGLMARAHHAHLALQGTDATHAIKTLGITIYTGNGSESWNVTFDS